MSFNSDTDRKRFFSESRFILAFCVKEKVSFIIRGLHLLLTQTKLFHLTSEESPVPARVSQGTGTQRKGHALEEITVQPALGQKA